MVLLVLLAVLPLVFLTVEAMPPSLETFGLTESCCWCDKSYNTSSPAPLPSQASYLARKSRASDNGVTAWVSPGLEPYTYEEEGSVIVRLQPDDTTDSHKYVINVYYNDALLEGEVTSWFPTSPYQYSYFVTSICNSYPGHLSFRSH